MHGDKKVILENWLLKSDEALNHTKANIENNSFSTAQNRLYYAVFYAICALAEKKDFRTSKHGQLLGWFNKEFIHTKLIDESYGKLYKRIFEDRQKCDYTFTFKPQKEILEKDLTEVRKFIKEIKELLG